MDENFIYYQEKGLNFLLLYGNMGSVTWICNCLLPLPVPFLLSPLLPLHSLRASIDVYPPQPAEQSEHQSSYNSPCNSLDSSSIWRGIASILILPSAIIALRIAAIGSSCQDFGTASLLSSANGVVKIVGSTTLFEGNTRGKKSVLRHIAR